MTGAPAPEGRRSEALKERYIVDGDDFQAAGSASSAMKKLLRSLGVPPEAIRRAAICMYEGEINMVIHANGGEAEVAFDGETITMTLADSGPGIPDPELALREGWSTATDAIRDLGFGAGMGLPNMKRNSDEMTIDSTAGQGTTITMTVRV
ncbi:MAG: ATP-binding protein [Oscillospiraceae bacterium]|jgi:anti-sigma regulatory factor (Ser/Thr protein kinase)|nr:ATP-binding protein [Oscillospiraceae bacterium]